LESQGKPWPFAEEESDEDKASQWPSLRVQWCQYC
jgi:hypothetical protein